MKKLIAKTRIGQEFFHSKSNAFFASENAQRIANALNETGYQLADDEAWHVYDHDFSQDYYVERRIFIDKDRHVKIARL